MKADAAAFFFCNHWGGPHPKEERWKESGFLNDVKEIH